MIDSGQISKVCRVTKPGIPLKAYEDSSSFKLFPVDIGLLSAMTDLDPKTIIKGNLMFTEFKGALTEQYVFQELRSMEAFPVYYWSAEKATAETDFLIQYSDKYVPVEVKAEENLRSKSLKVFNDKFRPDVALRISMSDFRTEPWLKNIPLYALSRLPDVLAGKL
jgi:predicted AAA+ superfamily ATPase